METETFTTFDAICMIVGYLGFFICYFGRWIHWRRSFILRPLVGNVIPSNPEIAWRPWVMTIFVYMAIIGVAGDSGMVEAPLVVTFGTWLFFIGTRRWIAWQDVFGYDYSMLIWNFPVLDVLCLIAGLGFILAGIWGGWGGFVESMRLPPEQRIPAP